MNLNLFIVLVLSICLMTAASLRADDAEHARLAHNPFSRPEVLKPKPPPPPAPEPTNPLTVEKVELNLTATMVSRERPMVIVDGELLGIGDRIQGLKLISVMEGKAVFRGNGRNFTFEINDGQPKQGTGRTFN